MSFQVGLIDKYSERYSWRAQIWQENNSCQLNPGIIFELLNFDP